MLLPCCARGEGDQDGRAGYSLLLLLLGAGLLPPPATYIAFPLAALAAALFMRGTAGSAARPAAKSAPRSLRRALLTLQVNAGSHYRCGKRT